MAHHHGCAPEQKGLASKKSKPIDQNLMKLLDALKLGGCQNNAVQQV
jgi:hypothetical protein